MSADGIKICSRCGEAKHLADFSRNAGRCKPCRNEIERLRRESCGLRRVPCPAINLAGEVWRAVPGLEGVYEVSDLGRVRSVPRTILRKDGSSQTCPGTLLRAQHAGNNVTRPYLHVSLRLEAERAGVFVHQLVAWAFLGDPPPGHHVHHVNGNATDNQACNLTYRPALAHLSDHNRGEGNPSAILCGDDVREIRRMLAAGVRGAEIARLYGVCKGTISSVHRGRTWKHLTQEAGT